MVYTNPEVERFVRIPGFPNYNVSNMGVVVNVRKGRRMETTPNQNGDLTVGLSLDNHQYRRSVKVLVARAFCPGEDGVSNTVLQLDGNPENLHWSNLVWRPRWLCWKYNNEMSNIPDWAWTGPIRDEMHGSEYENMVDAAMTLGVLISDIRRSMRLGVPVYPHGMTFSFA